MNNSRFEMKYFYTYYYCNLINNILGDQFHYCTTLYNFYGDSNIEYMVSPYRKWSLFHEFIAYIITTVLFDEASGKEEKACKHLHWLFELHDIDYVKFEDDDYFKDDFESYFYSYEHSDEVDVLLVQMCDEIFHIMFLNRQTMYWFNSMMSDGVKGFDLRYFFDESNRKYFVANGGKLKRAYIPTWVKDAVFYRDRGRCVQCDKDLSGLISIRSKINLDHIVPLAEGGLNDITNMQLLCEECNSSKSDKIVGTSYTYERWYQR